MLKLRNLNIFKKKTFELSPNDQFAKAVVGECLKHMFRPDKHFSICDVDSCAKTLNIHINQDEYDLLRPLHCISWREMEPDFVEEVQARTLKLLIEGRKGVFSKDDIIDMVGTDNKKTAKKMFKMIEYEEEKSSDEDSEYDNVVEMIP